MKALWCSVFSKQFSEKSSFITVYYHLKTSVVSFEFIKARCLIALGLSLCTALGVIWLC